MCILECWIAWYLNMSDMLTLGYVNMFNILICVSFYIHICLRGFDMCQLSYMFGARCYRTNARSNRVTFSWF